MIKVALCIGTEHDPWLILLAVFVCCAGSFSMVQMFERARSTRGLQMWGWSFLTAVAAGATIWCTHFVAMLAFDPEVPVRFDPVLTIGSLIVAILGSFVGFLVAATRAGVAASAVGGALFGAAISAMHFTGMAAYRLDGIISWDAAYVAAAVTCALMFSAGALVVLASGRVERNRLPIGIGLIVTGIATLHFVAMTAVEITPLALGGESLSSEGTRAMALATALVALVVIAAGVFAALIDRETRSDAMRQLHHMAMTDALTGLPNRNSFHIELARQLSLAQGAGAKIGLCAIDLNGFKEVNDIHGHKAGDEALIRIAERLREAMGPGDVAARLGGDEFVAITRFEDFATIEAFAGRIDSAIKSPVDVGSFEARLGASIGVAVFPDDADGGGALLNNADLAMYRAKRSGSAAPCYYDSQFDEAIRDRRELANDLRRALESDQLELHYQVQADTVTRSVTGYEALLRWKHPVRGSIPPAVFIPIAEDNGLILALGEWVLRRACTEAATWPHRSKVAVNVSPLQLAHAELPRLFQRVLLETGLPPRQLEVELTETAIIADRNRALHVLRQIKALGVGVALDDFGTGYSSLETLRAFPFDKIKLDRFFAAELGASPQATAIVRAVLALGKSLHIPVLAEGIETEDQLKVLIREGCDEVQGFLLGYPGPMVEGEDRTGDDRRTAA